ncbi:MAG: glycoside hydrolase family 32 protein [Chloroflexi bacterium]|nr:glycoside hydrolase family 32 protein [Chloroflexota bacterium]
MAVPTLHSQRPTAHFTAERNWINDPNGLIQLDSVYHLFYQHNPNGPFWGDMHWGHATSRDLVHWKHQPLALFPDHNYDAAGVFSGCAVRVGDVVYFHYTGVQVNTPVSGAQGRPCLAISRDGLRTFEKHPANPLVAEPPAGVGGGDFRDHSIWREADGWHMAVGASIEQKFGAVWHYRSDDLVKWDDLGPMIVDDAPARNGQMWECPDFFALGNQHVLLTQRPYPWSEAGMAAHSRRRLRHAHMYMAAASTRRSRSGTKRAAASRSAGCGRRTSRRIGSRIRAAGPARCRCRAC